MKYIQVAGTNAKGSVCEYIYGILLKSNYKCGVFTSPHIFTPRERIRVNGECISAEDYEKYMSAAREKEGEHLFLTWWRAAYQYFLDKNIDVAVIEAGIGGSCDITTKYIDADIAVITKIGLDHTRILGDTKEDIAFDKCGIIKENSQVISFDQPPSVKKVIENYCAGKGKKAEFAVDYKIKEICGDEIRFDCCGIKNLIIHTIDEKQAENACCAVMAAKKLGIEESAIREGLKSTKLFARMQKCGNYIVDGAHNPQAVLHLMECCEKYFGKNNFSVVTAVMKDKDYKKIAEVIGKYTDKIVCTALDMPRALGCEEYAEDFENAVCEKDIKKALLRAEKLNKNVVIAGSFYLAAEVLKLRQH